MGDCRWVGEGKRLAEPSERWKREGGREGGRRGREEKRRGEECYIQFYRGGKPITRRYTRNTSKSHPTFRIVIKKEKGENRKKKRMGEGKAEG